MSDLPELVLVSSDDKRIRVSKSIMVISNVLKAIFADDADADADADAGAVGNEAIDYLCSLANADDLVFPTKIEYDTLVKVVKFCEFRRGNPMKKINPPLYTSDFSKLVSKWNAEFIDLDVPGVLAIASAANYLEIDSLLKLSCAKAASFVKDKTLNELKATYKNENRRELSKEDELELRKKYAWY